MQKQLQQIQQQNQEQTQHTQHTQQMIEQRIPVGTASGAGAGAGIGAGASKSGFLEKKGHIHKTWKRRYVVWNPRQRAMSYYSDASRAEKKGAYIVAQQCAHLSIAGRIENIQMVFDIPERRMARSNRFDVRAADGTLLELSAPTAEEKRSWILALSSVVASAGLEEHPRVKKF